MSITEIFNIGYLKTYAEFDEEVFLSITPNFYRGPGIQRDGLIAPRMTDPHAIQQVRGKTIKADSTSELLSTTDAFIQRAGTWTIFNHTENFINMHGKNYQIIGIQSCGDLTMNPWHVALVNIEGQYRLCRLNLPEDPPYLREPVQDRIYRCLVKWRKGLCSHQYEFIDLKFHDLGVDGIMTEIIDDSFLDKRHRWIKNKKIDINNITEKIEFALSGKPIIQRDRDIALSNVIDSFQDVRHIFNLPTVQAYSLLSGADRGTINFGEFILYNQLNARRGALHSSIIIDLEDSKSDVQIKWCDLEAELLKKHYKEVLHSPTRKGEFRRYSQKTVELFFPFNVYPFGVLGGKAGKLVCLAAGGLSGRVGTTLEGITRIMYDFFGCEDALVLDEGFDTFHIVNPNLKKDKRHDDILKFNNDELLERIAGFTLWRLEKDRVQCKSTLKNYKYGNDLLKWPLNKPLIKKLKNYVTEKSKKGVKIKPKSPLKAELIAVEPHRAQMRAVLFFAKKLNNPIKSDYR